MKRCLSNYMNSEGDSNRFGKKVEEAVCPICGHRDVSYIGFYYTRENCLYKSDDITDWLPQRSKDPRENTNTAFFTSIFMSLFTPTSLH